ncbi:MAG TPA: ABC transporter permease [Alphaproteobacteria bacterium]|nr:ABC transporter permease [Alphaproteobacteria bacterium]
MTDAAPSAGRLHGSTAIGLLKQPLAIAFIAIVLMLVVGELVSPGFASPRQIIRQLVIAALLGIVAAGQNLVILGGREGIDLSVGGLISLGALVAGNVMQADNSMILPALAATLAVTFAIGVVNGLGATVMRIPPLVMTLGMAGVLQGALVLLTRGRPSGRSAPMLGDFINDPLVLGIPGILFIWAALGAALVFFLRRTSFGLKIYAVGTNEEAAHLAGVAVRRTRILLFGLSGMFAGLAGFFVLGYTSSVFIGVGNQYVLPSIIAVVIGGTSLAGGIGGYVGTMAGAVVLVLLQSILTTLNIEPFGRQIIFGATLLVLMLFYGRQRKLRA